ncbi:MAG: hypothetical protein CL609_13265 [Anaerolineaceae bacterium]|nr:hypothetical protein [Anaerolineaceae bacterium]
MQISSSSLFNPTNPTISKTTAESLNKTANTEKENLHTQDALSGVTSFAMSMQISELNFSQNETNLVYRKDNSLALHATSSTNINLKTELFTFDITLSAESLGLNKNMFADPLKPITLNLQYTQSELAVSQKISIKKVQTLRTPQEIIQDLVEGLTEALQDPENKSIMYHLDEEAIASLVQSDSKMAKLFSELVMIMNAINLMKKQNQPSHDYIIYLSGKGNPYLEVKEETQAEAYQKEYKINITILPPQADATSPSETLAEKTENK